MGLLYILLDKHTMTCIYHDSFIQSTFTALKNSVTILPLRVAEQF